MTDQVRLVSAQAAASSPTDPIHFPPPVDNPRDGGSGVNNDENDDYDFIDLTWPWQCCNLWPSSDATTHMAMMLLQRQPSAKGIWISAANNHVHPAGRHPKFALTNFRRKPHVFVQPVAQNVSHFLCVWWYLYNQKMGWKYHAILRKTVSEEKPPVSKSFTNGASPGNSFTTSDNRFCSRQVLAQFGKLFYQIFLVISLVKCFISLSESKLKQPSKVLTGNEHLLSLNQGEICKRNCLVGR